MFNKFLIFVLTLLLPIGIFSGDVISSEEELVNYINDNIQVMREVYNIEFSDNWDVNYYVDHFPLLDENDELKAFLIQFDNGYLTVGLDLNLYEIVTTGGNPFLNKSKKHYLLGEHYYIKVNDRFIPNSSKAPNIYTIDGTGIFKSDIYVQLTEDNTDELDNFQITYSIANDLKTTSGDYGSYNVYTRTQYYEDCGAQAGINLMYTFDRSGVSDLAKSNDSNTELSTMRNLMNWTTEGKSYLGIKFYGIWPKDFKSGLTNYLPNDYRVVNEGIFGPGHNAPAAGLYYSLNVVNTAHYAMIIGSAQSDAWWIFKTNYDIISHWDENHSHYGSNGEIGYKYSDTPSYYYVESKYRQDTYNIQKATGAKWWEVWKSNWENLVA